MQLDDKYVHDLMKEHVFPKVGAKFEKYLYTSTGEPQGMQYKVPGKKASINIYLPKGTVRIGGTPKTSTRDELLNAVSEFTEPKSS